MLLPTMCRRNVTPPMPSSPAAIWTALGKHEYRSSTATSSMDASTAASAARPQAAIAGERCSASRSPTNQWSCACAVARTHASGSGARSSRQISRAAAWSTWMLAFMHFRYGEETRRLAGPGVTTASALIASRDQASGLAAATSLKRAHQGAIAASCSSSERPAAPRSACSNIGY